MDPEAPLKLSVILPTYNERDNIIELIDAIEARLAPEGWSYELIVIDDDSPDKTAEVVQARAAGDPAIKLHVRTAERGLSSAIFYGIRQARGNVIVVMDTDFNHDPEMLPQMVKFLEYYDIVIGSRFTMGGGMEDTWRYRASYLFNVMVRFVLRTQVQDNLSGFFAMRRERLMAMELERIFAGYGEYFMRLLFLAWRQGYKLLEVPVFYHNRRHGQSKSQFVNMFVTYTVAMIKLRLGMWPRLVRAKHAADQALGLKRTY